MKIKDLEKRINTLRTDNNQCLVDCYSQRYHAEGVEIIHIDVTPHTWAYILIRDFAFLSNMNDVNGLSDMSLADIMVLNYKHYLTPSRKEGLR